MNLSKLRLATSDSDSSCLVPLLASWRSIRNRDMRIAVILTERQYGRCHGRRAQTTRLTVPTGRQCCSETGQLSHRL